MSVVSNAFSDEGFSTANIEPIGQSVSKRISTIHASVCRTAIWVAEPATHVQAGSAYEETFIVLSGQGSILIDGHEEQPLQAGSIVTIPPNTRASLRVTEKLRKFLVIGDQAQK